VSETAWILSAGFALLLVTGVPFAIALLLTAAAVLLAADIEPVLLAQTLIAAPQSAERMARKSLCALAKAA